MPALFYTVILIYFSLHVVFFLNLNIFWHIFSYIYLYAFFNQKVLTFLSFLAFSYAIFNNSPYSTYVNNFCIVSFDVIRRLRGLCDKPGFTKFLTILTNCSAGVTVSVDKYVDSSIYFFGFNDFLLFTLDLNILGPLKCLVTSGSIKSIETTNSLFLWAPFLIQFFLCICKT